MSEKDINNPDLNTSLKMIQNNIKFPTYSTNSTDANGNNSKLSEMGFSKPANPPNENKFLLKIYKKYKISIYKPLIPLKIAQFSWFGGGSYMVPFLTIFLKQKGVSLSQLSWMNIISPIAQLCGTALTGIVADKTGKSKPVLVANLLLVMSTVIGILLLPSLNETFCRTEIDNFSCPELNPNSLAIRGHCEVKLKDCNLHCLNNSTSVCNDQSTACSAKTDKNKAYSDSISLNKTVLNESCFFDSEWNPKSFLIEMCNQSKSKMCHLSCSVISEISCQKEIESWSWLLVGYIVLYVSFLTTFTNVYRCFDITVVALVKEHNTDFGLERFFAISGNLLISPLAGYIADVTTVQGGEKNYAAGFYLFIFMVFLVLGFLYKIPVRVKSPGEKMWRKSIGLMKNPDILSLIFVVLVLGAAWNFTKIYVFWFLSNLNAPSILIGLIPSVSALYGLPLLLTSNWWVKKLGCTNIIILAFVCYVLTCIGFSFLVNPWYSLPLEVFSAVEYYLLWVAVVSHSHELAPEGMSATVVGLAGALHFSIGKATGGLVGGFVMTTFGDRIAFRFMAIVCLISAILYTAYLYIKHISSSKQFQLEHSSENQESKKVPSCSFVLEN